MNNYQENNWVQPEDLIYQALETALGVEVMLRKMTDSITRSSTREIMLQLCAAMAALRQVRAQLGETVELLDRTPL